MIWFSMIIPFVVFILVLIFFHHKLNFLEIGLMLALPLIIVFICKVSAEYVQTKDKEFWGGWVKSAEYYEDWNEYIHQTCTRSYPCGSDSKGNTQYCTETYDCSYVQYHPEYWQVNGSNGEEIEVGKNKFEELAKRWNSRKFVDMKRRHYTNDGDKYVANGTVERSLIEPITVEHSWTNRVQASRSVFKFPEVDPKKYGLFEYPSITDWYRQKMILGDESTGTFKANSDLAYWNAMLGAKKRLRCYILIFKDKPIESAIEQQSYWQGGNKNEFIVSVGVDKDLSVKWCHVFSWSEREGLKVDVKDYVLSMKKLDLEKLIEWMAPQLDTWFVKKNFRDFDYLQVDPPGWMIGLTFFLTALCSVVTAVVSVKNEA